VGIELGDPTARGDARAVFGGLQLACAGVLAFCALRPAWLRPGLALQLATFAGLAGARALGVALDGAPSAFGLALFAGELAGLGAGVLAALALRRGEPR
jgi:hypothetical protein